MPENGLCPIHDTAPSDIFVCAYPRSGNTWFQNLVSGVVHGVDPEFAHDSLIQDLVPGVDYKRFYKRYGPTAYFKSHALPQENYRRVVYLLRDGRDAMVSYYHYLTALKAGSHAGAWEPEYARDFLRLVKGEGLTPCFWHEHVQQWAANPFAAEMMVIKYEDLQSSLVRELKRFCDFAGLKRPDAHLEYIAAKASFSKARAKELQMGWDNKLWPREKAFIRRGVVGSYRDEMPPQVLAAFVQKAGPTLARFGYQ